MTQVQPEESGPFRQGHHANALGSIPVDALLLHREKSDYQLIELREHPRYGRQLVLDSDLQISASDATYNTAMVAPLLGIDSLNHVAILGGGDGGVLGELLSNPVTKNSEDLQVDLVDIDDRVIQLSREHFEEFSRGRFDDPRSNIIAGDAFGYIFNQRHLDAVVYDLTMDPLRDDQSRGEFVAELLTNITESLRPGGVLSMQCCGAEQADDPTSPNGHLLAEILGAVRSHLSDIQIQRVFVPSYEEMWLFLSARKEAQ